MVAQRTISGTVISDNDRRGIPGASVVVRGSSPIIGVTTDIDGRYSITVPNDAVLLFSFMGYSTQSIEVGASMTIDVTLRPDAIGLEAVVVVGYGTMTRERLTGAVSTVTEADFRQGVFSDPGSLIAGKVPGVNITTNDGRPGAGSTIRIRGGASLNASNDPLIVIDGLPISNVGMGGQANPFTSINPNDIESMTILRDAAATAIFGSRASNGVIIITTRSGGLGADGRRMRVDVSTLNSLSTLARRVDVLNANEFRNFVTNFPNYASAEQRDRFIGLLGNANTDWQDEIFRNAFSTDNNVAVSGVFPGNIPYRVSIGNLHQNGTLRTDHINRTTASISTQPRFLNDHLRFDVNVRGSHQVSHFGDGGAIGAALRMDPTQPVRTDSDEFNGFFQWTDALGARNGNATANPVSLLESRSDIGTGNRLFGNLQADYRVHWLPDLRANVNLGFDLFNGSGEDFRSPWRPGYENNPGGGGRFSQYDYTRNDLLFEFFLNYARNLGRHTFDVMAGYTYQDHRTERQNFPHLNYARTDTLPGTIPVFPRERWENTLISFFGRVNYSFNDRYMLTASLRTDGSSRFSRENRWGVFPAVSAAWRLDRENFLVNSSVISNLRLRLGWGITGQQEFDRDHTYQHHAVFSRRGTGQMVQIGDEWFLTWQPSGFDATRRWEQTATWNAGIDYALFGGRIYGAIDAYFKQTTDLLNETFLPMGSNFTNVIMQNIGSMESRGVEFSINYIPVQTNDLRVDVGFNLTFNQVEITQLTLNDGEEGFFGVPTGGISGGMGNTIQIHSVGRTPNSFWVLQQIYDANGRPIDGAFVDRNGNGMIDAGDFFHYHSPMPRVFLGFNLNVDYRNFSLSTGLRGSIGNYVYNNLNSDMGRTNIMLNGHGYLQNSTREILNTGFRGGDVNHLMSNHFVENASFLKMDYLSLNYNFGRVFDIGNLSANFTVQNVFTITQYSGVDPEIHNGRDNNIYPVPRIFSLGLRFSF